MTKICDTPERIEPCFIDDVGEEILDLVAHISAAAEALVRGLHPKTAANLADLVRVMNCYYSNRIEGHNTTPREIEQAMAREWLEPEERRSFQLEAAAHIRLQQEIDQAWSAGELTEPAAQSFLLRLHCEFYRDLPSSFLRVEGNARAFVFTPGVYRHSAEQDVSVGRHIPPESVQVAAFMAHFEKRYRFAELGKGTRIVAIAAAHHRFNYIHPFPDGNGRVSRLMSHAMGLCAGIGAHGLWSISRGLARGLGGADEYLQRMDNADMPRQGDLDGRGNLSRRALIDFTRWFLQVSLDQIQFMDSLFALSRLSDRLRFYVRERGWSDDHFLLLQAILLHGEMSRGDVCRITGLKERTARDRLAVLLANGIVRSDTPKGAVTLGFPLHAAELLFPRLF